MGEDNTDFYISRIVEKTSATETKRTTIKAGGKTKEAALTLFREAEKGGE